MTPFAISGMLTGISSVCFGIFVFILSANRKIAWIWFLFALSVGVWGFSTIGVSFSKTPEQALLAWQICYGLGVIWIPPLFYTFVCNYLDYSRKTSMLLQYLIAISFVLIVPTKLLFSRIVWMFGSMHSIYQGPLYLPFLCWWMGIVIYSHYMLLGAYKSVSLTRQNQIKYFFLATVVGFAGGGLSFLPPLGIYIYPWGNFTVCLYPIIMSYAIAKHRLMDVNVIIRKTLVYSTVMGILTVSYMGLVTIFAHVFEGLTGYQTVFSSAVAACLITIGFQPLRKKVQTFVDGKFFRQYVDREEKLYELSREVITHTTPEAMAESLIRVLGDTLHPKSAALYLKSQTTGNFLLVSRQEGSILPTSMSESNALSDYFADHPQPFVQQDLSLEGGEPLDTRRPSRKDDAA